MKDQSEYLPGPEKRKAPKLANPARTAEVIRKYGFSFRKRYGQNFLIDPHVPERIVEASGITKDDCVVEVGPGIGTLTQYLSLAAGRVVAVEIDRMLIPILEETLEGYDNVTVLNQDILKTDLRQICMRYNQGRPLKVVANLPYYITTPILMELLSCGAPILSLTVMVQKEVASRMQAGPGSKEYGALSVAVQYHARAKMVSVVSPGCFMPRPEVESAVVMLDVTERPDLGVKDEALLFSIVKAAFGQRRKTLANSLKNAGNLPFTRQQVEDVLQEMNLPANVRGEALSLEQFAFLAERLKALTM